MLLKLDVLASTTIKRKKPWPTLAWLGKDVGDLYLFDSHRLSQLYLPSGKTKKKIPLLQSFLEDVQGFGISPSGLFVAGALNSGRVFIWNKSSATVKLTAVLDKIRNVQPGTKHSSPLLYISDCGRKVLLLSGFRHVFLWETQDSNEAVNTTSAAGDSLRGTWHQIQCGNYVLPDERNKETAIDGVFFVDTVCGTSCSLSWVFNKGDKIHVTTLHLLWTEKNYNFQEGGTDTEIEEGTESSFSPTWHTFKHSLYHLTPAERVMKSRKAYIARISPDGQVMVLAMNQKFAAHNRVMFYSLSQTAVAVVVDLKGCGAKMNVNGHSPFGKSWWIADMAWTRDSLLVLCITRRGSVAVLTKLGEPLEICTEGCSLHTGPSLFLPLHPKITFQKSADAFHSDSSESCASEKDPLSQRFSVAVHPYLPVVLSSDGYLVTVMQLPPVTSYHGIMTGFMRDVTRLVPDVDVEIQAGNLSRVSSVSRINIMQSEANVSRGVTSTEFLSDAPSENNSTGSSTVPGYGLASGDQGMSFFGLSDPELESSLPEYEPGSLDAISHAQSLSIVALALGTACGVNWKQDVASAMDLTVNVVTKFFHFLLRGAESISQLHNSARALSSSIGDLSKRHSSSPVVDSQLSKALAYFRMVLEVFQWDSTHRNAFSWAFHLTHGIVREVLLLRDASIVYRVASCMTVLKLAERVLNLVYSSGTEKLSRLPNHESSSQERQFKQEPDTKNKEADLVEGAVGSTSEKTTGSQDHGTKTTGSQDHDTNAVKLDVHQQLTLCQTHLGGSWLLLYNFTSESCKKMQRRRSSLFSVQEGESRGTVEKKLVELLCEIQEKLQTLGVRIPSNAVAEKESVEGVSAYLEGSFHNLPPEVPQDSLFSRRRSSQLEPAVQGQSPVTSRRYGSPHGSPYRENMGSQQSLNSPGRLSPMGSLSGHVNEQDSKTLLSILYMQLQQYDLRCALDLVYSLIDPAFSCEQFESNGHFSLLPLTQSSLQAGSHQANSNHHMDILLQNYPTARVADNRGLKVVQTLARFMSAYFSNLSLYVYPPYQPMALPPLHQQAERKVTAELEDGPQGIEHIGLDRAKVSQAVRDQGLYELWSANSTLELFLVSGLVSEGAWLARNLGDWKNAMLLSFAVDMLTSRFSETATDPQIKLVFPAPPRDIKPLAIALSRLSPSFKQSVTTTSGDEQPDSSSEDKSVANSSTARKSQGSKQGAVDFGIEVDNKIVKEVSRILEAGVVAGLDLVPSILTGLVSQLKHVTSLFKWIVPEEFYLPFPPSFCPQPMNLKKDALSPAAEKEEKLRTEVAGIVQQIFLLLNASNCLVPCVRWYTEQLVVTTESWYNVIRTDSEFPVPSSLAGYADRGFSFHERRADRGSHVSPKKKGKKGSDHNEEKGDEKLSLPSSIMSVLGSFREFCAIMWLLHARDKMSKSSRKYRQLRSQSTGSDEEATTIHSICWETLLWTTRLTPFSSLLGAADKINDTLLTLLSELPPSTATAELTAQFFNDPDVVQTTSGRAKFKRLMAQFRGVSVRDDGGLDDEHPDEPLSVYYRKKCMDWEEELVEREKLFGKVCDQFFVVDDASENATADEGVAVARLGEQVLAVGTAVFETQPSFFQFLDTFFMITVSKTVLTHHNKAPYPMPLLSPYSKHLLAPDTKSLAVLQQKAHSDTPAKPIKGASSLFRSHSFTDVRTSRSKPEPPPSSLEAGVEIKRSSSLNDVARLGSLPGIRTLGSPLLELLPSLTWLSRWSMEGSSVPSSNFDLSVPGASDSHPVMRIHVPLPLLVNGLWLLQNVYWPWVSDTEVQVEIKVIRQEISPQRKITGDVAERSSGSNEAATPPKGLRKVLSDSNIDRSSTRSRKRNSIAGEGRRLQEDHHHKSTPDILRKSQTGARSVVYETTELSRSIPTQGQQEEVAFPRPSRKDLRVAQRLDRIPKSNSEPNIPNIVVQSPTTDEEKEFSGALKKRHSLQENGRTVVVPESQTTYHSDTELTSSVKPIVTSTPAKTKHSRKAKKKERKKAEASDEEKEQARKRHEEDARDWKKQETAMARHEKGRSTNETLATQHPAGPTHPIIRTAPSRHAKRKTKSSPDQKDQEKIDAVVTNDARQREAAEPTEWSQSSATEALVSQGKMELLLVVRPGDGGQTSSLQTGIPLVRIPTLVDSSQSSEVIPQSDKTRQTTRAETASQTDHHRVTSAASQTLQHSGISSEHGHVTDRSDQMTNTGGVGEIVARTAWAQTEPSMEPKQEVSLPFFPLLQQQQASTLQQKVPPPPTTQYQTQARALPLLHFPIADASSKLDLSKMRLLEVPKRNEDSPLLHFPEPSTPQPAVPDLSKIKFLQIQPKQEIWANTAEPKGPDIKPAPANNRPFLRMTGSQARSNDVDLSKMRLYENPPRVREAWPLLETPRQAEVPRLIPLDKILAFEKGLRDKLAPFSEPAHYPHEKENIRPPVENKPKMVESHSEPGKVTEQENKRNTASRQRRRQALEKQNRPRSTSPLFKSRRGRALSRSKSSQGKIITVQPAKKARKVEKVFLEKQQQKKGPIPKKSAPADPRTVQKAVSKKALKKSVSLSDSELELSEISDQVFDVSEEEKYFRVERSPEPITVPERGHKLVKSGREKEEKFSSKAFEDVMPGPPSMRRERERIGRKLHEVDRQMAAYRSGSSDWKTTFDEKQKEFVGDRQKPHETRRQQTTVGIQVDEGRQPPAVKSVGFFHSGLPDRAGANVFKVSSSSQTDEASARPIPMKRDLVTSGVQTEKESVDSDHVRSHAPVLPPDIFLNLQMPKSEQETQVGVDVVGSSRGLPPEPADDNDQTVTDQPVSIRGRQLGVDVGSERGGARPAAPKFPDTARGRQFLSVADIDHEQWLEVQSTPMTTTDVVDEENQQEGRRDNVDAETELPSRTASQESRNYESEEEQERAKQEDEKPFEGPDRVTVELMDSTDVPVQRLYPLPFPTAPQSSARAVSTQFLNDRMKEMTERIDAMDQITHNMDREFKSSRVLLSAIQSIDEVLNPSSRASSSRGSGESRRGMPRRWGDNAPWRRKGKTSAERHPVTRLPQTEDVEDSIDVDVDHTEKDRTADAANVEESKEGETDHEDAEEEIHSEKDERDEDRSFNDDREDEDVQVASTDGEDKASDAGEEKAKPEQRQDSSETEVKTSVEKENVSSFTQDSARKEKPQASPLESLALSHDQLKEILQEKDVKRSRRDPSPDARQYLKEWMNKKRSERQAEWKGQQEELRAQEHQPFMSPTQGSTNFKKIKLMEKERDVKRRKKEDQHKQQRIDSASNLLSEMLAEPVPKPTDRKPNLRYGGSVNSRYSTSLAGKKKRTSERYKKLPKAPLKSKRDRQESAPTKENRSRGEQQYHVDSPLSDDIARRRHANLGVTSQNTPRYDFLRTSSPVTTGGYGSARLKEENIDKGNGEFIKGKQLPTDDDFWRSKSPTGAEFVTTQTYRKFTKEQPKRLKARDAAMRKTPPGGLGGYGLSQQFRGTAAMGRTFQRTRPTDSLLPGSETLTEIDRLLEDIPDDGFTFDQERLEGIESLLEGDDELRDLLSDVDWRAISKPQRADYSRPSREHSSLVDTRGRDWRSEVSRDQRPRHAEPSVPSGSGVLQEFDGDVSPWNTRESMRTSDDVAQLLAEVDEAVGNMSESTGSTRSQIDWEEVDKIMGET